MKFFYKTLLIMIVILSQGCDDELEEIASEDNTKMSVTGTITFYDAVDINDISLINVKLIDYSIADREAVVINSVEFEPDTTADNSFNITFDESQINPSNLYAVSATAYQLNSSNDLILTHSTMETYSVITNGFTHQVDINLSSVSIEQHTLVYRNNDSIQCEYDGVTEIESAKKLTDLGINVHDSSCGYLSDISVAALCGLGNIDINIHSIDSIKLKEAETIGFMPVMNVDTSEKTNYVEVDCKDSTVQSKTKLMELPPYKKICTGVIDTLCLVQINQDPNDPNTSDKETIYSPFYSSIAGFDFVWGHSYKLSVYLTDIENPPADGSSIKYDLKSIIQDVEDVVGTDYEYSFVEITDFTFTERTDVYYFYQQPFQCAEDIDCSALVKLNKSSVSLTFEYMGDGNIMLVSWQALPQNEFSATTNLSDFNLNDSYIYWEIRRGNMSHQDASEDTVRIQYDAQIYDTLTPEQLTLLSAADTDSGFEYNCQPGICPLYAVALLENTSVIIDSKSEVLNFLGEIDTPAELKWLLSIGSGARSTTFYETNDLGYLAIHVINDLCGTSTTQLVQVYVSGTVEVIKTLAVEKFEWCV